MAAKVTAPERDYSTEIIKQRAMLYQQLPSMSWDIDMNTAIVVLILVTAGIWVWRR